MAGNVRFGSSSTIQEELGFTGNGPNGQRGDYSSASLGRSGSFREGNENRAFSSGASTPRATVSSLTDVVLPSHVLLLDHITMGDQKYTRTGELRRALGISLGNAAEESLFGAAHHKPLPPIAIEELKRIKASVIETTSKARGRIKRFNESLSKLNKYYEALNLKKQQPNEISTNERSVGSNFLKMGISIHRNSSDIGTQRLEEKKNIILNKRGRSSVAELRADSRSNILPRQRVIIGKDREVPKDAGEVSDMSDEKIRRLPAGGEGWDKKMKRKRSVGSVFMRPLDSGREVKRALHNKPSNEPGSQSYDAQGLRSRSFNATSGSNKLDSTSSPSSSNSISKNESEKVSLTRDFAVGMNKERLVTKANKLSAVDDNHMVSSSLVTKGKASRAPRGGSAVTANSSPNLPRTSGALEVWEQPASGNNFNSVAGSNNRKRPLPTGSSSPPMVWIGQRPQKISRTRRANVVSPVSNHDDVQMPSEVVNPSDFVARITSGGVGINGSVVSKDVANGSQHAKMKHENVPSPALLSESEETGAGENHDTKPKEKNTGTGMDERSLNQNVGFSVLLAKKNKVINKEDIGDGVRRQGRTGRVASPSKASISMGEKLDNPVSVKPSRNTRTISDKNGSKSGRPPLKKISDRKASTRLGQAGTASSPDLTGDSDDDREALLAAANFACNAHYLSCSGSFWKKLEPVFAPVCLEDSSFLRQELKSSEELHERLSEMIDHGNHNSGDLGHEGDYQSQILSEESDRSLQNQVQLKILIDSVDQGHDDEILSGSNERRNKATPLYQRILSALILEDESEDFKESSKAKNYDRDSYPGDGCSSIDFKLRNRNGIECGIDSMLGFQTQKHSPAYDFPCNGTTEFHNELCNDEFFRGNHEFVHSKNGIVPGFSNSNDVKSAIHSNASEVSALDCLYEQMSLDDRLLTELQSIGLCPEAVPDLADGEVEAIDQDIIKLEKGLHQQVGKKKDCLSKIVKEIENSREMESGALEQVAMNRLVELAYKKQLATKGSYASKYGVPKVSKQVAVAFMKKTLARCRRFDDTGKSCFSEPTLRDIILSMPAHGNDAETTSSTGLAINSNAHPGTPNSQQDLGTSGSFSGRVEGHDLLSDKFGRGLSEAFGSPDHTCDQDFAKTGPISNRGKKKELLLDDVGTNASFRTKLPCGNSLPGGVKGKRSEREREKEAISRNPTTKPSRTSQNNAKNDRKTKSKPKQKTAQLQTSGDGTVNKLKESSFSNKKKEPGLSSLSLNPQDSSKRSKEATDIADLQELELGISNDFDGHQDLNNWFNFDEDGLPEHELAGEIPMDGLEIPMDDIFEVFR